MIAIYLRRFSALALALLSACTASSPHDTGVVVSSDDGISLYTVAGDLRDPWGMDFLEDGRMLVTEKSGQLLLLDTATGQTVPVAGVPASEEVGQGGLLDVLVYPDTSGEPWIYLSYAVAGEGGYSTRIARARFREDALVAVEELFTAQPFYPTKRHFGSRLLIVDGYLYATVGDRGQREYAQSLATHNGKVMRLHLDGRVPADNPFVDQPDAKPEIWSYGHRNPQGMAQNPVDGSIWVSEHGPQGGDEINRIARGANYGWPVITYGEEYGGGKIGEGTEREGMEQPLKYYLPSIGTGGIDFYTGDRYPGWEPSLLVTALRYTHLNRVVLSGKGLGAEHRLFTDSKMRFRDVQVGPDGYIYVLAGGGSVLRLLPAPAAGG